MSSDDVKLDDLVKIKGGKRLPKGANLQKAKNEHPYIRVRDMGNKFIPRDGLEYVPDDVFPEIERYIVESGDLIISIVGTIGLVSIIDEYFHEASQTENCAKLSGLDKIDGEYLYYFLISKTGQDEIHKNTVGAVQKKLPLYGIKNIDVIWPEREKREVIVNHLSNLDQKIHLNQQANMTLEAMAQAIFKSWFVDFDPVRAKIEAKSAGRDPNRASMAAIAGISLEQDWDEVESALDQKLARMSEAQQEQLFRTAQLFPDELEESGIEEVPKGWDYSTIGKEFDIVNGQSPPGSSYNEEGEGAPFYQGRTDFGFRFPTKRVYCTEPKRFAKKGDTLLSVRAPVGDLNIAIEDCCIGRGLASLRHNLGSTSYTYYAMKQVQVQIETYEATGTVFGSINQKQLKALDTISPDDQIINEFHRIVEPIDSKIMNQVFMNRELSELRDILLPKLISGEVGV